MPRIDDTEHIDADLFDAALGDVSFDHALKNMIGHFSGGGGVIFELNRATGAISNWIGPGLESGAQDYIERLNRINPRMRYSLRHAAGHVAFEGLFTTASAMDRSEFYDAIFQLTGVRYFLGSRLYDEGDISVFHSVEFAPGQGHPDREMIDAFARTSRNLGKAWKLAKTQREAARPASDGFVFEHLPWAIFSVNEQGCVATENSSAGDFLVRDSVFSLVEGCLLTSSREVNDRIRAFLANALAGHSDAVALPAHNTNIPLVMQSLPVPARRMAYLFIRNPQHYSKVLEKMLPKLFGLTDAEVRVLGVLSRGQEQQSVADELQISRHTVRNQLQSIYRKTGTRNRGELLAQVLGLIE